MRTTPPEFDRLPAMRPPASNAPHGLQDWEVLEPLVSPPLHGRRVAIRAGAFTDGASIPWWAWSLLCFSPWSQPLLGPALCHDMLYAGQLLGSKTECDAWFFEFMGMIHDATGAHRINRCKRNLIWAAPRYFGGAVWRAHTPESIAHARCFCQLIAADAQCVIWPEVPIELACTAHAARMVRATDRARLADGDRYA